VTKLCGAECASVVNFWCSIPPTQCDTAGAAGGIPSIRPRGLLALVTTSYASGLRSMGQGNVNLEWHNIEDATTSLSARSGKLRYARRFLIVSAGLMPIVLGSCMRGAKININIVSSSDVRFTGETLDDEPFCLSAATIALVSGPVVWDSSPSPNNSSCFNKWGFLIGGRDFRFRKSAFRLKPGSYYTTVTGSGRYAYAEFVITR
jgi:hypothetical protein